MSVQGGQWCGRKPECLEKTHVYKRATCSKSMQLMSIMGIELGLHLMLAAWNKLVNTAKSCCFTRSNIFVMYVSQLVDISTLLLFIHALYSVIYDCLISLNISWNQFCSWPWKPYSVNVPVFDGNTISSVIVRLFQVVFSYKILFNLFFQIFGMPLIKHKIVLCTRFLK